MIGELHHPVVPRESERPSWLVVPETGLYTGVLIVGAIGSGKTTACMYPFAQQLLSWQADRPGRRASALVLEVKGDFCHDVRGILEKAGRADDYLEIGLGGAWQWNPLDDPLLDTYSLAYGVASLINQLFGKSRDPFWQQAYTNLVRWIIELYRLLPGGWGHAAGRLPLHDRRGTVRAARSARPGIWSPGSARCRPSPSTGSDLVHAHKESLEDWAWEPVAGTDKAACQLDPALRDRLKPSSRSRTRPRRGGGGAGERAQGAGRGDRALVPERLDGARPQAPHLDRRGHQCLPVALRSAASREHVLSTAAGIRMSPHIYIGDDPPEEDAATVRPMAGLRRRLPPLAELIEEGRILALNMPAGANPALGRAIGVLLKNAWMQALLRRPAEAARRPGRYLRPAVFICDEYQAFATVGQDDPAGDEKAFALTRQCRCIPIVATQSISSLRSVLSGTEAWRTLIQTLRTRIFLSLSDESSARIASEMCGSVMKTQPSYTFTETTGRPEFSLLSGRAGGGRGTIGASKSFRQAREPVFTPRDFSLLANYQAICLPYDGTKSLPARRVYLKPHYLPRGTGYWRLREEGRI